MMCQINFYIFQKEGLRITDNLDLFMENLLTGSQMNIIPTIQNACQQIFCPLSKVGKLKCFHQHMQEIIHIQLLELEILSLGFCNIFSIEAIAFLKSLNLKQFTLVHNNIVSLKAMEKTNFKGLILINLQQNRINSNELKSLIRCRMNKTSIETLWVWESASKPQKLQHIYEPIILTSNIFKLQTSRILNKKFDQTMKHPLCRKMFQKMID